MSAARKIILATLGSAGDVHPFIGLGVELKRRGHEVVIITAAFYAELVRAAGLQCVGLGTVEAARRLMEQVNPNDSRSQLRASRAVLDSGLGPVYQQVTSQIEPERTIVVHNQMCFGARFAHETHRVPLVTLVMQPFSLRSAEERRFYHPRVEWFVRLGRPARRLFNAVLDRFFFDRHVAPVVNAFRATLGLPLVSWRKNPHWLFSPQCILGAWPEWFGPLQPDWPRQVSLTGFIMHDQGEKEPVESGCGVGDDESAPIVFTPGSWVARGESLFAAVADACRRLGCSGVLVTRHAGQVPSNLPPGVRHAEYSPFSKLFPRAAVVVHHGGVGTAAQGLRAGRPQICVPVSGDQYDNSARLSRLGVGITLPQSKFTGERLAGDIKMLLNSEQFKEQCRHWQRRVDAEAAVKLAGDRVEELTATFPR